MFEDTTYSVCAFAFIKKPNIKQTFPVNIGGKSFTLDLLGEFNYSIGEEIFTLPQSNVKISRLLKKQTPNSNIFLYALDTRNEKIRLAWRDEHFYGKNTDRVFATICFSKKLTKPEQLNIIDMFNTKLNYYRKKYFDMFLTNYRDHNRKRISFELTYKIISNCVLEL